jgi:hypothetical protein
MMPRWPEAVNLDRANGRIEARTPLTRWAVGDIVASFRQYDDWRTAWVFQAS